MYSGLGDQLHKAAGVLSAASIDALYLGLVSHWDDPASVVIGGTEPPTLLTGNAPQLDWAESLLDEARLQREGYFHPAPIRQKWTEHLSGARNWQYHLWDVLMFQASLEVQ